MQQMPTVLCLQTIKKQVQVFHYTCTHDNKRNFDFDGAKADITVTIAHACGVGTGRLCDCLLWLCWSPVLVMLVLVIKTKLITTCITNQLQNQQHTRCVHIRKLGSWMLSGKNTKSANNNYNVKCTTSGGRVTLNLHLILIFSYKVHETKDPQKS